MKNWVSFALFVVLWDMPRTSVKFAFQWSMMTVSEIGQQKSEQIIDGREGDKHHGG
jgi:hypothetical protein